MASLATVHLNAPVEVTVFKELKAGIIGKKRKSQP
jgi:hypothetical protein